MEVSEEVMSLNGQVPPEHDIAASKTR
jgi:hypothetical protein